MSQIPTTIPLYPQLVKIHDNVVMHRTVKLITHDMLNAFLMKLPESVKYKHTEILAPIEIMDNVYIGAGVTILGNVRIGPNVIINAGSVVTNDIPPNSIVAGVPAKVVGSFDTFCKSRVLMDKIVQYDFQRSGKESIDQKTIEMAWAQFDSKKKSKAR